MNKPKIRFKGFEGEWEKKTIGEVANVIGGGTPSTNNSIYWDGPIQWFTPSEVGQIKYIEKSQRTITTAGLEKSSAKLIPANSVLLSSRATIGEMSINTCECTTNQGFQSLVPCKIDLEFLYSLMLTKKNDLIRISHGSTFLEISASKVRSVNICVPKLDEQQEIGTYFKQLDSLISLTEKKISSLKQVKQASLQSMFPQEGETTPRIRFKGFEGEWKKIELKEVGSWFKGKFLSKSDIIDDGLFECIHYGELFTIYNEIINKVYSKTNMQNDCLSKSGDILFPDSDVTPDGLARCSAIMKDNVILGGGINVLRVKNSFYSPFVSFSINQEKEQIIKRVTGTTVRHINAKSLSEIEIFYPTSLAEQTQIANYFSNLDKQIALHEARLDKLKKVKASCLDLMFV